MDTSSVEITARLKRWAEAKKIAARNSKLLLDGGDSKICVQRMKVLGECENLLWELRGQPGLPFELFRWFVISENQACGVCQLNSNLSKTHPECLEKISEYLAAEKALLEFAEGL